MPVLEEAVPDEASMGIPELDLLRNSGVLEMDTDRTRGDTPAVSRNPHSFSRMHLARVPARVLVLDEARVLVLVLHRSLCIRELDLRRNIGVQEMDTDCTCLDTFAVSRKVHSQTRILARVLVKSLPHPMRPWNCRRLKVPRQSPSWTADSAQCSLCSAELDLRRSNGVQEKDPLRTCLDTFAASRKVHPQTRMLARVLVRASSSFWTGE